MTGGRVDVLGSAGDDAGVGDGRRLAAYPAASRGPRWARRTPGASRGMTGGEIVVGGSAGADAGARMRRGLLFVGGDAGSSRARAIIAGTAHRDRTRRRRARPREQARDDRRRRRDRRAGHVSPCLRLPAAARAADADLPAPALRPLVRRALVDGGIYRRYCGDAGDRRPRRDSGMDSDDEPRHERARVGARRARTSIGPPSSASPCTRFPAARA